MAGETAEAKRIVLGMRDSDKRRELAALLAAEGYSVGLCTDQTSLAQRIDETVDVVMLADELAAGPLDEVSAALERLPPGSAIPFILLSRDAEPHAALKARLPSTINDFVVLGEPVGPASLLSCLTTCMRLRQHQRAHHAEATERADQRTRFERLIENLPIGVCFIDADGNTLLSNPKYDEYVPNRKIPSTAPERARRWVGLDSHGQVIPPSQYVGARALRGEQVDGQDYRYYPDEGGERWLRLSGVPLYDHAEQPMGAAVVIIDVDAERRNEVMLRQFNHALEREVELRTQALQRALDQLTVEVQERSRAEEQLRHSQKMDAVGQLTGGIAHDFNNLLMAVLGSLDLLRRRMPADPALLRLVDNARAGAERGASLTARMLTFARKQELHKTPIDLPQLIAGMKELLLSSLGPTIQLQVELPARLAQVKTDPNQLETALLNLAANARDAMSGVGRIRIAAEELTLPEEQNGLPAGRYVRLDLSDNGTGMDEATLKRAAEPFFTTKGVGKGTGLGLSMVHGLAEQSGGRLVLRSSPGAGTTAEIWLPALAADNAPASAPVSTPAPDESPRRTTKPLTLLAVDDDELVLFSTAGILEAAGHRVLTARSAGEALDLLQVNQVDILITDHAMPLMSGAQLAAVVRETRPQLPILLVSGYAELPSTAPALPLHRLAKPFSQDELLDAIEQLC